MNRVLTRVLTAMVVVIGGAAVAQAQSVNGMPCPQLLTVEKTRQTIEMLRADREAGIDRLPPAYQRAALESLYRWYWPRLARLEAQQAQVEANCRAAQLRQDESLTRESPRYHVYGPFRIPEVMRRTPVPRPSAPARTSPPAQVYPPYRSPRGGGVYAPNAGSDRSDDPFSWSR